MGIRCVDSRVLYADIRITHEKYIFQVCAKCEVTCCTPPVNGTYVSAEDAADRACDLHAEFLGILY